MREILFRGKRVDNGKWVYGSLIDWGGDSSQIYIIPFCEHASSLSLWQWVYKFGVVVNPETVGQYTGLTDKNGKKIFEGDILQYQPEYELRPLRSYVVYDGEAHNYPAFDLYSHEFEANGLQCAHEDYSCEVIGNRWDNPELLKEENDDE